MKFKKKYLLFIFIPLVLIAVGFFIFLVFFPTAGIRDGIISDINTVMGAETSIGAFDLKIFPRPYIEARDVTIKKQGADFIHVDRAAIVPLPWELISKRIQGELKISGLKTNISYLKQRPSLPDIPGAVPSIEYKDGLEGASLIPLISSAFAQGKGLSLSYEITALHVEGGEINFIGDDGTSSFGISNFNISIPSIEPGVFSFDVQADGNFTGVVNEPFEIKGKITPSGVLKSFSAQDLSLKLKGANFILSGEIPLLDAGTPVNAKINTKSLDIQVVSDLVPSLSPVLKDLLNLSGAANLTVNVVDQLDGWSINGEMDAQNLTFAANKLLSKTSPTPLTIKFDAKLFPTHLTVNDIEARNLSSSFHIIGSVLRQPNLPVQLSVSGSDFSMDDLATVSLLARLITSPTSPNLFFTLQGDLLDPKNLDVLGTFRSPSAVVMGHDLKDIEASISFDAQSLGIDILRAKFLNGSLSGNGRLEFKENIEFGFQSVLSLFNLEDASFIPRCLSGDGYLITNFKGTSADLDGLKNNLEITGTLIVPDGRFTTSIISDIANKDAIDKIAKQAAVSIRPVAFKTGDGFKNMLAGFDVSQGMTKIGPVTFGDQSAKGRVEVEIKTDGSLSGAGEIYLLENITRSMLPDPAQRAKATGSQNRLAIPFLVEGSMAQPSAKMDDVKLEALLAGKEKYVAPEEGASQIISSLREQVKREKEERASKAEEQKRAKEEMEKEAKKAEELKRAEEMKKAEEAKKEEPKVEEPKPEPVKKPAAVKETKPAEKPAAKKKAEPKVPAEKPEKPAKKPTTPQEDIEDILKIIIKN